MTGTVKPSEECPMYSASRHGSFWMVQCDEGWRLSIVCTGMYEWSARWLVRVLQGVPYAPDDRP